MLLKVLQALEPVVYTGEEDCGTEVEESAAGDTTVQACRAIWEANSVIAEQYIASLRDNSSLHDAISDKVANAYDSQREVGVFALFFTSTLKDRLRKWTWDVLVFDGHTALRIVSTTPI